MKHFIILFFVAQSLFSMAQQAAQTGLYNFNPLQFNPAYAGSRQCINATLVHRSQWVGLADAPRTQFLSVHAPIETKKLGVGVTVMNDKVGVRSNVSALMNLAYHLKFKKSQWQVSLGLSGGVINQRADFGTLQVFDANDPKYLTSYSLTKFNFGAGIYAYHEKAFIGLSVPQILEPMIGIRINPYLLDNNQENPFSYLQRHSYLTAGLILPIKERLELKPSILLKYTANAPLSIDLNFSALINKQFWLGAMYRYNEGVGVNFAYSPANKWSIGYAFEFPINQLTYLNKGSHELCLSFDFRGKQNGPKAFTYF